MIGGPHKPNETKPNQTCYPNPPITRRLHQHLFRYLFLRGAPFGQPADESKVPEFKEGFLSKLQELEVPALDRHGFWAGVLDMGIEGKASTHPNPLLSIGYQRLPKCSPAVHLLSTETSHGVNGGGSVQGTPSTDCHLRTASCASTPSTCSTASAPGHGVGSGGTTACPSAGT